MLLFMGAALVLIMIPGPDQALVTRNVLTGGRRAGLVTMLGGASGISVHATAAAFGVSALLIASAVAFTVLKVIGTLYLLWMGIQTFRAARASKSATGEEAAARPAVSPWRYARQGFLSNALNPKVALFFVTFLPQFLPTTGGALGHALLLSGVFAVLYVTWFSLYALTVDRIGAVLRRPKVRARIEQVTGALLIGFGLNLALASH